MSEVPPKTNNETAPSAWDGVAKKQDMSWDGLTNAQRFQAQKAKEKERAVDPAELAYYQANPDKIDSLIRERDGRTVKEPDWDNITTASERFQAEKERAESLAVDPGELAYYQANLDKLSDLIHDKNVRVAERAKAAKAENETATTATENRDDTTAAEENGVNEAEERERREAEEAERQKAKENENEAAKEAERQKAEEALIAKQKERELLEKEKERRQNAPLTAVNADFTLDRKDFARDFAEKELNAEVAKKGLIARIWKGNLFKKYFQKKYERQILSGEKDITVNGEKMKVDTMVEKLAKGDEGIERFVQATIDDYESLVHDKAGESLEKADPETTAKVRAEIEWFASAKLEKGQSLEDLRVEFGNRIARIKAENRDNGKTGNEKLIDNYFDVADQARKRYEHGVAMEKVMEGFAVYNAKVRSGIRTEAHRDWVDRVTNKWENSKIGQFIPPEFIAAALGTVQSLTQTGARALGGAGVGIAVSAVFSGLRERNRVTEDRARMMRDIASGNRYSGQTENPENLTGAAKRRAKYEARMGGTLYDTQSAKNLTANLTAAMEKGDRQAILQAITEARVRSDLSDSERKDLISYSAGKIGSERLALDLALIRAEKSLSPEGQEKIKSMRSALQEEILEGIDEKDTQFKKERRKLVAKAVAKTAAIGTAFFFGSQEVMATLDPNKVSLLEEVGVRIPGTAENVDGAQETILASGFGFNRGQQTIELSADQTTEAERLQQNGWQKGREIQAEYTKTDTEVIDITPAESDHKISVIRDAWANNGTGSSDGNELRAYLENGQFRSGMTGNSTLPNGQVLNYEELVSAGRVKGIMTIGGAQFEIVPDIDANGALTWGENGIFTTTTGETIQAVGSNGEKLYQYFEIAADTGVDANGIQHIIPLATDVGSNSFTGTMQQVVETTTTVPAVFEWTKEVPITTSGVVFAPTPRIGLGAIQNPAVSEAPASENPTPGIQINSPGNTGNNGNPTRNTGSEVRSEGGLGTNQAPGNTTSGNPTSEAPVTSPNSENSTPYDYGGFYDRLHEALPGRNDAIFSMLAGSGFILANDPEALKSKTFYETAFLSPEDRTKRENINNRNTINLSVDEWWDRLSPDQQRRIRNFEEGEKNDRVGIAFRSWLENHPETPGEQARARTLEDLGDSAATIGNNGVDILVAPENTVSAENIKNFWSSLDDDTKNAVRRVVNTENEANSRFGVDFRNWFLRNNLQ